MISKLFTDDLVYVRFLSLFSILNCNLFDLTEIINILLSNLSISSFKTVLYDVRRKFVQTQRHHIGGHILKYGRANIRSRLPVVVPPFNDLAHDVVPVLIDHQLRQVLDYFVHKPFAVALQMSVVNQNLYNTEAVLVRAQLDKVFIDLLENEVTFVFLELVDDFLNDVSTFGVF